MKPARLMDQLATRGIQLGPIAMAADKCGLQCGQTVIALGDGGEGNCSQEQPK